VFVNVVFKEMSSQRNQMLRGNSAFSHWDEISIARDLKECGFLIELYHCLRSSMIEMGRWHYLILKDESQRPGRWTENIDVDIGNSEIFSLMRSFTGVSALI
jgi:hypothetical protein